MFTPEEAVAAQQMIDGAEEQTEGEVQQSIADHPRAFDALDSLERTRRLHEAGQLAPQRVREEIGLKVGCPSCGADAVVSGEFVRAGEPPAAEDAIVHEIVKIPTHLRLYRLRAPVKGTGGSMQWVSVASSPGRFHEDPAAFCKIEFDLSQVDWAELVGARLRKRVTAGARPTTALEPVEAECQLRRGTVLADAHLSVPGVGSCQQ